MRKDLQEDNFAFTVTSRVIADLLEKVHEIADLDAAWRLLLWDQIMMPTGAQPLRDLQLSTLEMLLNERKTAPALATVVRRADNELAASPAHFTALDHALLRETQRQVAAVTMPIELCRELARVRSETIVLWRKARQARDFTVVASQFARLIALLREQALHTNPHQAPYATLFARFEPDLPLEVCLKMLKQLRLASIEFMRQLPLTPFNDRQLRGDFPLPIQEQLARTLLEDIGYQPLYGRLDVGDGFTVPISPPSDGRLSISVYPYYLDKTIGVTLHEGGHLFYAQGVDPILARTLLADSTSYGMNEAQARFWETSVGHSVEFWRGQYTRLQSMFPQHFQELPLEKFVWALNQIRPAMSRISSDELTYNIHICIRTELEQALIDEALPVHELPALWRQKYQTYLGVTPAHDGEGVLQDYHWSAGNIGYFPTYALGNMYAAQFAVALRRAFPDMDERIGKGELRFIQNWQREQIFRWGKVWTASELCERVTGEPLNPSYLIRYLEDKFAHMYKM